ncbi:hypothetical protein [Marichromatium bheemlicum]|uniref:Uncharacterized protein n=1 Tax=Marichromatium bheemlicum TaxID=365339 RepID=A0ABX1I7N7_9GAMM|nr:hypothetical protein [Marichromatium bheemlicum]NKN33233.1 hypothetical protein [Marichromatium bheemlicum]
MSIIPHSLGSLIRFLIGIFLLQGVTALLVYTALSTDWQTTWPLFALLAGAIGILVALWFNTIADAYRHRATSRLSERFSKEREKIRVKAEQQRAKAGRSQERLAAKARRSSWGASLKTGAVVGGAVGIGVTMMLTQFVTLGLVTLSAAGGAALGYGVRVRQQRVLENKRLAAEAHERQMLEMVPEQRVLPRRRAADD